LVAIGTAAVLLCSPGIHRSWETELFVLVPDRFSAMFAAVPLHMKVCVSSHMPSRK
jgi:hypothetical protein